MDKTHFLEARIRDSKRRSAKDGYVCPLCKDSISFHAEPKLWDHARKTHLDYIGNYTDDAQARKELKQSALEKAQNLSRRGFQNDAANSQRSSNDSLQPNTGAARMRSPSSSRPLSAPGLVRPADQKIGDFEKLNIGHTTGKAPVPADPRRSLSPLHVSRATGEPCLIEPKSNADERPTKSRRAKAFSGGALDKDPDYERKANAIRKPDVGRQVNPPMRLFNPNLDDPNFGKTMAQDLSARRSNEGKAHAIRRRKEQSDDFAGSPDKVADQYSLKQDSAETSQPRLVQDYQRSIPRETNHASHDRSPDPQVLLQPETRPISHEQLVVEVKGIYAGLIMVEAKCIDVDEKQSAAAQEKDPARMTKLGNEQWQALIALHRTLLHEHHDFFLASQHPSASAALSKLAVKYHMPARMWRHGIHAFLEVLRHRLPESLDHMLAFIYIAYSMMALLYETVSTFEDTWIECLGDLGRYRMAIEDDDVHDRETWSGVARFWYSKAADKSPGIGRLYHHLAILARPFTLQQLSLYTKSLTCVVPFGSARGSILTLFNPVLDGKQTTWQRSSTVEILFIKLHAILFTGRLRNEFFSICEQLLDDLRNDYIEKVSSRFKDLGVSATIAGIAALFQFGTINSEGKSRSIFRLAYEAVSASRTPSTNASKPSDVEQHGGSLACTSPARSSITDLNREEIDTSISQIHLASHLVSVTSDVYLRRSLDSNVFPTVHVFFVFIWSLVSVEQAMILVEKDIPWEVMCLFLNAWVKPQETRSKLQGAQFPKAGDGPDRPLPEDFIMRGQLWCQWYFPVGWFEDAAVDDEERTLELPSMTAPRIERILWLGYRIAAAGPWIKYDEKTGFGITEYTMKISLPRQAPTTSPVKENLLSKRKSDAIMAGNVDIDNPPHWSTGEQSNDATVAATIRPRERNDVAKSTCSAPVTANFDEDQIDIVMQDADAEKNDLPSPPLTPANPGSITSLEDQSEQARTSAKSADSCLD